MSHLTTRTRLLWKDLMWAILSLASLVMGYSWSESSARLERARHATTRAALQRQKQQLQAAEQEIQRYQEQDRQRLVEQLFRLEPEHYLKSPRSYSGSYSR